MDFVIKSVLIIFSLTGCIQAVTLDVNEGNSTCIKADLLASFSITYNTSNGTVCKTLETFYLNLGGKKKNLHQHHHCLSLWIFPSESSAVLSTWLGHSGSWQQLVRGEQQLPVAGGSFRIWPRTRLRLFHQWEFVQCRQPDAAIQPERCFSLPRRQQLRWVKRAVSAALCSPALSSVFRMHRWLSVFVLLNVQMLNCFVSCLNLSQVWSRWFRPRLEFGLRSTPPIAV